ncbi:MAG: RNA 2',3'-cyclic phosphodiesterase [Solirubrobacterales bacterium]
MTDDHETERRVRLFVALDFPDAIRAGLVTWQEGGALDDPALRRVSPRSLHLTLCFLGHRPEADVGPIAALIGELEPRRVDLRLASSPIPVPRGRPRLFAVGAESEEAEALQAELAGLLEAGGFHEPEERPFWPHATIARVRSQRTAGPASGRRRGSRPMRVSKPPHTLPDRLSEGFCAVRMTLYQSLLKPTGAEYVSRAGLDLPSARTEKR